MRSVGSGSARLGDVVDQVFCAVCRHEFADPGKAMQPSPERPACPRCGSLARRGAIRETVSVGIHVEVRGKGRSATGGRPFVEFVQNKLELFRKTGRWRLIDRTIDRRDDTYDEVIKDRATGETVHETREPLSKHTGHGSARRSLLGLDAAAR